MLGLDTRATMDLDATIKGLRVTAERLEAMIKDILTLELDDGINFQYQGIEDIREKDEYGGYRVSLSALYFSLKVPLKIDITLGDSITPQEITHSFKLMLEERSIPIQAYNIETLLAEKLETILSRSIFNTRPRDFYDVYILSKLRKAEINMQHLSQALIATSTKRHTVNTLLDHQNIISSIESSETMQRHWANYQKDFSYATEIEFAATCSSIRVLMDGLSITI